MSVYKSIVQTNFLKFEEDNNWFNKYLLQKGTKELYLIHFPIFLTEWIIYFQISTIENVMM